MQFGPRASKLLMLALLFPFSMVMYTLFINPHTQGCTGPEGLEEGIEFAIRVNTSGVYGPWVPLRWTWRDSGTNSTDSITDIMIRGYDVEAHGVTSDVVTQTVTVCGESLLPANASEVQFRWMNTADEPGRFNVWALFNVTAKLMNSDRNTTLLDTNGSK